MELRDLRLTQPVTREQHAEAIELLSRPALAGRRILAAAICPNFTATAGNDGIMVRAVYEGGDAAEHISDATGPGRRALLLARPARDKLNVRCESVLLAGNPMLQPLIRHRGLEDLVDRISKTHLRAPGAAMAAQAWHRSLAVLLVQCYNMSQTRSFNAIMMAVLLVQCYNMSQTRSFNAIMMAAAFEATLARCLVESAAAGSDPNCYRSASHFLHLPPISLTRGGVWGAVAGSHGREGKLLADDGQNWSAALHALIDGFREMPDVEQPHALPAWGEVWVHGEGAVCSTDKTGRTLLMDALRECSGERAERALAAA